MGKWVTPSVAAPGDTNLSNATAPTNYNHFSGYKHRCARFNGIAAFRLINPYISKSPQTGMERAANGIIVTRSECDVAAQRASS